MSAYLVLPLLQAVSCLFLAAIVLAGNPRSFTHRLFSLFLTSLAAWGLLVFGMRSSPDIEYAFLWDRWVIPLSPFMSVLFYHFSLRYTGTKTSRWVLAVLYSTCLLLVPLVTTDLVFSGMQIKPYGYAPVFGPVWPFWILFIYLITVLSLVNFVAARRSSTVAEQRNRLTYIILGISLSIAGGVFDALPVLGLPLYPGAIIGTIAFCLFVSLAILRHHLLDIRLILRKSTAYILTSALITLPFLGIFLLVTRAFAVGGFLSWTYLVLTLVLALLAPQLWQRVQRWVDRMFYRDRYDYLEALEGFSRNTQSLTDSSRPSSTMVSLISGALKPSSVYLLQPLPFSRDFAVTSRAGVGSVDNVLLSGSSPLIKWLNRSEGMLSYQDLDIIPQLQSINAKEQEALGRIGTELIAPIKTHSGQLSGVLILGRKTSEQPYTVEDKQLIYTLDRQMAINLENARLYNEVLQARESLMTQQRELMKKTEELAAASQAKSEFLASMSHELRTPLNVIISFSELMVDGLSGKINEEQRQNLADILDSSHYLLNLINGVLDLSKIEAGRMEINVEDVNLAEVIDEVIQTMAPILDGKRHELEIRLGDRLPLVCADRNKLKQVLINLLSNANKFTPAGGRLSIEAEESEDFCQVSLTDSGTGIKKKDQERIFEAFTQGEKPPDMAKGGTGLGLALARQFVELSGGRIWVESKHGKGSKFIFTLPVVRGARAGKRYREEAGITGKYSGPSEHLGLAVRSLPLKPLYRFKRLDKGDPANYSVH